MPRNIHNLRIIHDVQKLHYIDYQVSITLTNKLAEEIRLLLKRQQLSRNRMNNDT